ncbi:hypothetical protein AA303_09065 [Pseudomonas psychrophila]|nr:hypothetical protein AA303_09065 [Pseudomonas psychrophila]
MHAKPARSFWGAKQIKGIPMGKLAAKQIENLTTPGTYEDGDGLHLLIKPNGKKYWVLRFQPCEKRREMELGT